MKTRLPATSTSLMLNLAGIVMSETATTSQFHVVWAKIYLIITIKPIILMPSCDPQKLEKIDSTQTAIVAVLEPMLDFAPSTFPKWSDSVQRIMVMKNCVKKMFYAGKKVFGRLQISPPIIAKNVFYYRGKTVLASKGGLSFFSCSMRGNNNAPINLHTQMLAPWMMFTSTCIQMGWHATSCYICNGCHVTWRIVTYPRDVTLNGHSPQGMLACETGTLADTHFVSERAGAKN